jgi:hypothetical protein
MKNKYLAIIRRAEFNSLFKYGRLLLNNELVVVADNANSLIDTLTKIDYDSTFAYLIIKYEKTSDDYNLVSIHEVTNVYALDGDAKIEFETSFDPRVKIENLFFDFSEVMKQKSFEDCKRGIDNVWRIFGFSDEEKEKCQQIINDETIKLAVKQMFDDSVITGEYPLWVYLMRYERHSYYPQEILGYFMDVVHVYCNYMIKNQTLDEKVEGTGIFKQLAVTDPSEKLDSIYNSIENSAFCNALGKLEPNCNFVKIAVIYLTIRDKYSEGLRNDVLFVQQCKRWGDDFVIASYLLGIYLGYDKTYDCLYDKIKLPFFKSDEEMAELQRQYEDAKNVAKTKMEQVQKSSPQTLQVETSSEDACFQFPFLMQKFTKSGKPSTAKGSIVTINNETDYMKYKNDTKNKWKRIQQTSNTLFSKK